ncbi:hypothetical protein N0V93_008827 [Gnomoniopsis smithogilvyi]|uniref:Uncharacterized protein n=1 Tax=Gnomoniopsis smithogilvyi TaxID=1191159 RepID=A0A9W8YME1_9PEZI|nr:hypothetical protein N0V93_008827 [Gnomoniopsis smithogilvyi]
MGAPGEKWHWHQNELVDFLKLSIEEVSKTRPVWLFVDALDECGKENANKLVEGFESLLRGCPSTAQFRICFSCRHYPILRLTYENALEICTERENEGDISTYVHAQLSTSTSEVPDTIEKTIRDRASGVFMWARLVVERVLDLELEGEGWKSIEDEIDKIPDELDGLYSGLIQSMKDKSSSLKLIQWICFALRPLSLEELQWALIVEADCSYTSLRQYGDKSKYVTNMENRLKTLSCGLAEVVPVIHARPVVQFIHQSVKDFFRKKGVRLKPRVKKPIPKKRIWKALRIIGSQGSAYATSERKKLLSQFPLLTPSRIMKIQGKNCELKN